MFSMISSEVGRWMAAATIGLAVFASGPARAEPWKVHEWGTFTVVQDEQGRELSGINIDDEPVPKFVHNLSPYLLNPAAVSETHWQYRQKGAPRSHPRVTMRLETPVIYFHSPRKVSLPTTVDVSVQFKGGWLTEFYPHAAADAPGIKNNQFNFGDLKSTTVSSLTWSGLQVGTKTDGPSTDWRVWLTPREVNCDWVTNTKNESERYLFYRGVANLKAPLRVTTDRTAKTISIYGNFSKFLRSEQRVTVPQLWLVHVLKDGTTAFRALDGVKATTDDTAKLSTASFIFEKDDYAAGNLKKLKALMHKALLDEGLFEDEAAAMLNTWERAYFTSPGLRLFYVVPDAWTDAVLPLKLSIEADVERAMIGRIELITAPQRELLAKISAGPASKPDWIERARLSPNADKFFAGRSDFGDLGVAIPQDYQNYLELGRFRNALVVAAEREQPRRTALSDFIDMYGLTPYRWGAEAAQ